MKRSKLHPTVIALGVTSFFTDFSSEMIYPLLPLFLSQTLGASALQLGFIEGFAEATASFFKIVSGVWADRLKKRKPLVVLGYSISGFFRPFIGLAPSWIWVFGLRFIDRVGKGMRSSPRDALISDVVSEEFRGRAFGFQRAMDNAGAVVGPLVAGALLMLPWFNIRKVFLLAMVPAVITVCVLVLFVKEADLEREQTKELKETSFLKDFSKLGGSFRIYLSALAVFSVGNCTDAFFLMRLSEIGVSPSLISVIWAAHNVVKMVTSWYGGMLSDLRGRKFSIAAGWLVFAIIYLGFGFIRSAPALLLLFLIYGAYYGLVEPSERAMVADLVPSSQRGTAYGFFHFVVGIIALPSSVLFGYLWKAFGAQWAFLVGAVFAFAATLILLFVKRKED